MRACPAFIATVASSRGTARAPPSSTVATMSRIFGASIASPWSTARIAALNAFGSSPEICASSSVIVPVPVSEPISDAGLSPLPSNSACSPSRPVIDRPALARQHRGRVGARKRDPPARVEPVGAAAQHQLSARAAARERALDVLDRDLAGAEPQRRAHLTRGQRRRRALARAAERFTRPSKLAEQAFAERLARPGRRVGARRLRHSGRDREQRHHVGRVGVDLALDALRSAEAELELAAHRRAADRAGDVVERDLVRRRIQPRAQRDRQQRGRARRRAAPQRAHVGRLQASDRARRRARSRRTAAPCPWRSPPARPPSGAHRPAHPRRSRRASSR